MRAWRLVGAFVRTSFQEAAAYRSDFFISLLGSFLNLATGVVGILVLFGQIDTVHGWDLNSTLALLGVYLTISAIRGLFMGPSLDSLAGMDGEIWSGAFDFTLLRPVDTQFFVSFRKWRLFALVDLLLGVGVLAGSVARMGAEIPLVRVLAFLFMLLISMSVLYSILLLFAALTFRSPGVLFTWVFDGLFQMARFPNVIYPGWLKLVLTWIVPVGVITTFPARVLTSTLSLNEALLGLILAAGLFLLSTAMFKAGLKRYRSASS